MALSTVIFVGESKEWLPEIVEKARKLKVGPGMDASTEVGPLISKESKARVELLIQQGVHDGAQLLLDGRGVKVPGCEKGNFVGPSVLFGVDGKNRAYTEEIFGPVLVCLAVDTLEEAIAFTNASKYGNGCAIFTQSGAVARKFQHEVINLSYMCTMFVLVELMGTLVYYAYTIKQHVSVVVSIVTASAYRVQLAMC